MRRHLAPALLLIPVLLLVAYAGSYFWIVEPFKFYRRGGHVTLAVYYVGPNMHAETLKRVEKFYGPMESFDRWIRPHVWTYEYGNEPANYTPPSTLLCDIDGK